MQTDRGGLSLGKEMIKFCIERRRGVAFMGSEKTVKESRGADGEHNLGTSTEDSEEIAWEMGNNLGMTGSIYQVLGCKNKESLRIEITRLRSRIRKWSLISLSKASLNALNKDSTNEHGGACLTSNGLPVLENLGVEVRRI